MLRPFAVVLLVLCVLCGMLGALALFRRWSKSHPELVRKLLHIGMGTVTLSLPWLFDAIWPVFLLAVLSIAILASMRLIPVLRSGVGQVLHGVSRFTLGEFYFVVAVAILWALYIHNAEAAPARRMLLYLVPILLLTFADSAAGLVGVYLGRCWYATPGGTRSLEGSAAFCLSALPCVHVPLMLFGEGMSGETATVLALWGRPLLLALLIAWLAMLCEALAWGGLDNLLLPLFAYGLLTLGWDLSAQALLLSLGMGGVGSGLVLLIVRRARVASPVEADFVRMPCPDASSR